jgi:hypothetical protein
VQFATARSVKNIRTPMPCLPAEIDGQVYRHRAVRLAAAVEHPAKEMQSAIRAGRPEDKEQQSGASCAHSQQVVIIERQSNPRMRLW